MILNRKTLWVASVLAASLSLATVGCGKKPSSETEAPAPAATGSEKPAEGTAPAAPAAGVGSIKGKINFTGTAPEMPELNRQADPVCAKTPMKSDLVVVNSNKTLKNVVLRVAGAKGGQPSEVNVDQTQCMYTPRIQAAMDNQEVKIHNRDETLHNVHTYIGAKTGFNRAQPKGAPEIVHKFPISEGDIVKFKCDVHPWMTGWLVLSDNAFNAVTGDSGEFEIKDVPAGTYTLKAFHENYGEKTAQVTVEAGKAAEISFDYDGTEKAAFKFREVHISAMDHADHAHH